jgi:hypothetical protein
VRDTGRDAVRGKRAAAEGRSVCTAVCTMRYVCAGVSLFSVSGLHGARWWRRGGGGGLDTRHYTGAGDVRPAGQGQGLAFVSGRAGRLLQRAPKQRAR